jgi:peptide/nickel transport system ATP-binding protein
MKHLMEVENLITRFHQEDGVLEAVNGVSYYLDAGEVVAFVGESGSGKSVTQYSLIKLIQMPPGEIAGGRVLFEGEDILSLDAASPRLREIRGGKIGVVFQEPMTSLNPVMTIGKQIEESVMLHLKKSRKEARERAVHLLDQVGIPDAAQRVDDYPHQFSGGMRQRILIAMALSCAPKILIADEATTALDVTTQAQILELLRKLVVETGTTLVIVTHNLSIVARYADRIYVMYAGGIVEEGTCRDLFSDPRNPYSIGLLNAVPGLTDPKERRLVPIDGMAPNLVNRPDVCTFLLRCAYAEGACARMPTPWLRSALGAASDHRSACHRDVTRTTPQTKPTAVATRAAREGTGGRVGETLLEVRGLEVAFPVFKGIFRRKAAELKAVDGVSFAIRKGETFALVGESGCGKTTVARAVLRLNCASGGKILFKGEEIQDLGEAALKRHRRDMSLIFQDPYGSLDPRMRAEDIVGEPLRNFKLTKSDAEYRARVAELFGMVGLSPELRDRVPHEFSGGQRQRIGIARALASNPSFIVCDEAISALDVSIQAQIINLLEDLQDKLDLTYLFIAHDLTVVRHISDRVAVMYLGHIVEQSDWKTLYDNPLHPYTQALLNAVPVPDPIAEAARPHSVISGEVPSLLNRPAGCPFSTRCPLADAECRASIPPLRSMGGEHAVACFKADSTGEKA